MRHVPKSQSVLEVVSNVQVKAVGLCPPATSVLVVTFLCASASVSLVRTLINPRSIRGTSEMAPKKDKNNQPKAAKVAVDKVRGPARAHISYLIANIGRLLE